MKACCPACGFEFSPQVKRNRSSPHHRRYFAMIGLAFHNWPEGHKYQPLTPEGLREYLQTKAGWGRIHHIDVNGTEAIFIEPKSISYRDMPQAEFSLLSDAVQGIIEKTIGGDIDAMLREHRMSA